MLKHVRNFLKQHGVIFLISENIEIVIPDVNTSIENQLCLIYAFCKLCSFQEIVDDFQFIWFDFLIRSRLNVASSHTIFLTVQITYFHSIFISDFITLLLQLLDNYLGYHEIALNLWDYHISGVFDLPFILYYPFTGFFCDVIDLPIQCHFCNVNSDEFLFTVFVEISSNVVEFFFLNFFFYQIFRNIIKVLLLRILDNPFKAPVQYFNLSIKALCVLDALQFHDCSLNIIPWFCKDVPF